MTLAEHTWTNPRTGAWVKASAVGENMVIERVMKPGTGKADAHIHFDYVESFEIIDGTATIEVDGESVPVRAVAATDPESVQRASDGYRRKYADSGVVDSMLLDEVLPTTLRLEPR